MIKSIGLGSLFVAVGLRAGVQNVQAIWTATCLRFENKIDNTVVAVINEGDLSYLQMNYQIGSWSNK